MDPALAALGEFGLIGLIRDRIRQRSPGTRLGIGDDAAILEVAPGREVLVTTDMLLEDVHFKRAWGCARELGRKTLAVNVSDIAAMGGQPHHASWGSGFPCRASPWRRWRPCWQAWRTRRPPMSSPWPAGTRASLGAALCCP